MTVDTFLCIQLYLYKIEAQNGIKHIKKSILIVTKYMCSFHSVVFILEIVHMFLEIVHVLKSLERRIADGKFKANVT